jgi:hypothetical protein
MQPGSDRREHNLQPDELADASCLAAELGYHPQACDIVGLYARSSTSFSNYPRLISGSLVTRHWQKGQSGTGEHMATK